MTTSALSTLVRFVVMASVIVGWLADPVLFTGAVVRADQATDDFNLAVGLYRKQRFDVAAETFGQFLKDHRDHPRTNLARLYYGLSLSSLEKYELAREQFERFIATDPENANIADARWRTGECSYHLGDYKAAIAQFREYLDKHEGHSLNNWARLFLGDAYTALKQWDSAETVLRELQAASTDAQLQADAGFSLATALEGAGKHDQAAALYRQLSEETSPSIAARALNRQGAMLFEQQKYSEALAVYDQILERFKDSSTAASAVLNSGMALFRLNLFADAVDRFRRVPGDSPYATRATLMTGLAQRELGQNDEARASLAEAYQAAADTSMAAEILFERANLERIAGEDAAAAQMYEDFADRWPDDRRVPDSLFNAAELHLELNDIPTARALLRRLSSEYPSVAMEARTRILEGRILLTEHKPEQAVTALKEATGELTDADDLAAVVGQYYLVRAYHESDRHEEAVRATERLRSVIDKPEYAHLRGVLATAAISSLQLEEFADVRRFADQFLASASNNRQAADVLAARAVALASLNQFDVAAQDVTTLSQNYPDRPQTWTAILQSAEAAWKQANYQAAATFFAAAAGRLQEPAVREAGLSGQAWSEYRLEQFTQAATTFGTLADEFPQSQTSAEAAFMRARSLASADQTDEAITASTTLFESLNGKPPAGLDANAAAARQRYTFDSGQLAARLLGKAGRIEEADQIWEQLAERFSNVGMLDQILDEWAWLNLSNGRYARSDEVYRQLLNRFPESELAGHARLSLAESEMQANRFDRAEREFRAILNTPRYGNTEKERALYHLIEIEAGQRHWDEVRQYGDRFLADYSDSDHAPPVLLLHADALLNQDEYDRANQELQQLRTAVIEQQIEPEEWTERLWVLLAEVALADRRYSDIDGIAAELESRSPESPYLFQMYDVQGRRWKSQAEPNFAKAREYFQKVIQHPVGLGTETAARCQYLIGETYLMQSSLDNNVELARKEFYRVYVSYSYDEWRAQGLYQAAGCELQLNLKADAVRSYEDLVRDFGNTPFAAKARDRLAALTNTMP